MKKLLLAAVLVGAWGSAWAGQSGNAMREVCSNPITGEVACAMFVGGFMFGMNGQANATNTMPLFCAPSNATPLQITDIYQKFLTDNPHKRHRPAVDLLVESVKDHWVCPDSR